jgi:hypothetical protein
MYSLHHNGYRLLKCTVTNTGHTQKNGAVLIVNTIKPHHSFVYTLYFMYLHNIELKWMALVLEKDLIA